MRYALAPPGDFPANRHLKAPIETFKLSAGTQEPMNSFFFCTHKPIPGFLGSRANK